MKLHAPRPSTVQPSLCIVDTDRSPQFHQKLSRSDVTTSTFRPSTISETLFQAVLQRANSYTYAQKQSNRDMSWLEHCAENSMSIFPMLSVSTTCAICGGMLLELVKIVIQPCEHVYCKPCLIAYFEQRILDNEVLRIPCPTFECTSVLADEQLQALLSAEVFEKYMTFKRNQEIDSNPRVRRCPKPDCRGSAEGGVDKIQIKCNECGFCYCYYCVQAWHEGKPCNEERDRLLDCWAKANNVKFCPNCRRKVEKMSGCDHMTCVKCRYDWCWKCGEEYSANHPDECEVTRLRRRNPPWLITLAMVFAPLLLPFAFVILSLYYMEELLRDVEGKEDQQSLLGRLKVRWVSYPVVITLALLLTPLAFLVLFLFGGSVLLLECRTFISDSNFCLCKAAKKRCVFALLSCVAGAAFAPVVVAGVLLGAVASHIAGLWFLLFKCYILVRRHFDSDYMRPKGAPGYLC